MPDPIPHPFHSLCTREHSIVQVRVSIYTVNTPQLQHNETLPDQAHLSSSSALFDNVYAQKTVFPLIPHTPSARMFVKAKLLHKRYSWSKCMVRFRSGQRHDQSETIWITRRERVRKRKPLQFLQCPRRSNNRRRREGKPERREKWGLQYSSYAVLIRLVFTFLLGTV
ncbi:hypothetical protein Fcan01_22515 [Folsomia candida]|uniref:Uncharacterized protein n=1 Tax=Folsomia candida TaxID=158441 RepID=A0A226DCX1_FOLCA|nr:hypothetical protein Fcan01_22515 [Folsomia candida]